MKIAAIDIQDEYKVPGIYIIYNTVSKKYYIGSSLNMCRRIRSHFDKLKSKQHINKHLQNAYNKYGVDNFDFFFLEKCLPEELPKLEQYYIDTLTPEYNATTDVVSGRYERTPEIRGKMRKAKDNPESKKRMSELGKRTWKINHIKSLEKTSKKIIAVVNGVEKEYPSINECHRQLKVSLTTINRILKGINKRKAFCPHYFYYKF